MRTLNLGILAHVDAGKTTLTERLLHAAGVIDEVGSVDDGNTQTDTLALERKRGITIKSAVVSFVMNDTTVNLIDTPGHPDFIAEVERVLGVLDGAVLVVSAVEGVQAQTRVLMRALRRLQVPALIFANKIDRPNAQHEALLHVISEKLSPAIVPMGCVERLGSPGASFTPHGPDHADFAGRLVNVLSDHDDALLAAYVDDASRVTYDRLREGLRAQTRSSRVHPVFFGSAMTGAGVGELVSGITELLPATEGDANGPLSGTVFKVERALDGEKISYLRVFSGTVRVRDRIPLGEKEEKVTGISVFDRGAAVKQDSLVAGRIGRVRGLDGVRIGDAVGAPRASPDDHHFSPPTLETAVVPCHREDKGALHVALTQLADQDPLIALRQDDEAGELYVSLYGEVQKEIIGATLADEYGLEVEFRETTTICIERPQGEGSASETIYGETNPFLATVGLRIEPAPVGVGVRYRPAIEVHGTMPAAFFKAVEDAVTKTLRQGLYGWQVTDCDITLTHTGYAPRQSHSHQGFDKSMSSTGADFRGLTPLVLMDALRRAGTRVYEPVHHFRLEIPVDSLGATTSALARLRAVPRAQEMRGPSCVLEGEIPASRVHELRRKLPGLTRGEGVLESEFDSYGPTTGTPPTRTRSGQDPLNREGYLLRLARRV